MSRRRLVWLTSLIVLVLVADFVWLLAADVQCSDGAVVVEAWPPMRTSCRP